MNVRYRVELSQAERAAALERSLSFLGQAVALLFVARRVMQRHEPLRSGEPRECSSLPRSQMAPRLGERGVGFQECRFNE